MLNDDQIKRLTKLERSGKLSPDQVVADARSEASPLHDLFEWDDTAAADAWRTQQARVVIHEVHCVIKTTTTTVEVVRYVPDPERGKGQGYVRIDRLEDDAKRQAVIAECNRALGFMRRAESVALALGYDGIIQDIVAEWVSWRDGVENPVLPLSAAAD